MDTTSHGDLPVACKLDSHDQAERIAAWDALAADALTATSAASGSFEARFQDTPPVRARLEQLVALERECCAFLSFDLEPRDAAIILHISVPGADDTGRVFTRASTSA